MGGSFSITIDKKRFQDELDKEYKALLDEMDAEVSAAAINITKAAVMAAPVRQSKGTKGGLKSSIAYKPLGFLDYEVVAPITYAPYVEFGTGGLVQIPKGFEDLAQQFYVNGKGRNRAQPFLIPAFIFETEQLEKRLKAIK